MLLKGSHLFTLSSKATIPFPYLIEDQDLMTVAEAFTFKLICNPCDRFPYENKAKIKEKFDENELKSIALKIRFKELYDSLERLSVHNHKSKDKFTDILKTSLPENSYEAFQSLKDNENQIQKILGGRKRYTAIVDDFMNFRVPFAMESTIAPAAFPFSNIKIANNLQTYPDPAEDEMSSFYILLQPSSNKLHNWSRFVVFIENDDEIMRQWFKELRNSTQGSNRKLANFMISYHISNISKNFVMSRDINPEFLRMARAERGEHRSLRPATIPDWIKLARS
jgi:hypothetical protein